MSSTSSTGQQSLTIDTDKHQLSPNQTTESEPAAKIDISTREETPMKMKGTPQATTQDMQQDTQTT